MILNNVGTEHFQNLHKTNSDIEKIVKSAGIGGILAK